MRTLAPGVHVSEASQSFLGLEVGTRMTVLEVAGQLLVHSPIDMDPQVIEPLGAPRWVVAPNKLHHLHAKRWLDAGLEAWAAPGLPEKRPDLEFHGVLSDGVDPFGDELAVFPLRCFPMTNEVALLHRPSRTLVVTDLVFHFTRDAPWSTRAVMTCLGGYPGCSMTLLERAGFHRETARRELAVLARQDFDRLIMAHGEVIETGGREAFRHAIKWLGIPVED